MRQIRHNVFETNSSSTHSLTMCTKAQYDAWQKGEVFLNKGWRHWRDKELPTFMTYEEVFDFLVEKMSDSGYYTPDTIQKFKATDPQELIRTEFPDEEFYTAEQYNEIEDYLEDYEDTFVTPGGETIIAFGRYGHD